MYFVHVCIHSFTEPTDTFRVAPHNYLAMASRKRNKGKHNKASRAAKQAAVAAGWLEDAEGRRQQGAVGDAVEPKKKTFCLPFKLKVAVPFLLKIGGRVRVRRGESRGCRHGFSKNLRYAEGIHSFLKAFANAYNANFDHGAKSQVAEDTAYVSYIYAAVNATLESYPKVWHNRYELEQVALFCLATGTDSILDQDEDHIRTYAFLASFFGQYVATRFVETQAAIDLDKVDADLPQISNFFKRLIPCSCLGDDHKEVKSNAEGSDEKEEEQEEPMKASEQMIEPTLNVDERGRAYLTFELGIVEDKYVPLHQKNVKEKSQEEGCVEDVKIPSKIEMMKQVQGEFWSDQLSHYNLPASYVPHQRITAWSGRKISYCEGDRCWHGQWSIRRELYTQSRNFDLAFTDAYNEAGGVLLNDKIRAAYHATRDKFTDVWSSQAAIECISVNLMSIGVDCLLEGDSKAASQYASVAYFFDQHVACNLLKDRPTMNWPKMNELYFDPDEHTLISFFKKRITCTCLDDMYEQVKSVKKLGICYNVNCQLPDRKAIRSFTKCCSRCRRVNYCSRECQEDNWQMHKQYCCGYIQRDSMVKTVPLDDQSRNTCTEVSADNETRNTCVE